MLKRLICWGAFALCVIATGLGVVARAGDAGPATTPPANRVGTAAAVNWTALSDATVHVSPTKTFKRATVVMRDGLITGVLQNDDGNAEPPNAPAGARVIDGTGLHVYAGFVEPMLEVDTPRPDIDAKGAHWSARVTPQRRALDGKGIDEGTAKTLRSQGYVAAVLSPKGGIFRGRSAAVSLQPPDADAAAPRPLVYAEDVYQSVGLEIGGSMGPASRWPNYPDSQMGAIALVRQTLSDATWLSTSADASAAVNSLHELDETPARVGGGGPIPLLMQADDELEVSRVAKIAKEFGREASVLGSGFEFRRLESVKKAMNGLGAKPKAGGERGAGWLLVPVNFPEKPKVASYADAEELSLRELMTWEQAPTNPRRLRAAGLTTAFTTARLKDRARLLANVREAIRHGLKEEDALAMLTIDAARAVGLESQLGTIEVGKRAGLVISDGPIFAKKTKLREVWTDGVRQEITAAPVKADGFYTLTLNPAPPVKDGAAQPLRGIAIDKDNAATIRRWSDPADLRKDEKSKAKSVTITEDRVAMVVDHEPFGSPGMVTFSGIVERDAKGKISGFSGAGRLADGSPFTWSARKGEEPAPEKPKAAWIGTWNLTSAATAPEGWALPKTLSITASGDAKVTLDDKNAGERANFKGDETAFVYDAEKHGGKTGQIKAKLKLTDAKLGGTLTLGETVVAIEGTKQADAAKSTETPKDKPAEKSDEKATDKPDASKEIKGDSAPAATDDKEPKPADKPANKSDTKPSTDTKPEATTPTPPKDDKPDTKKDDKSSDKSSDKKDDKKDDDKDEPADAPEDLGGLPFGPYAIKPGTNTVPEVIVVTGATVWTGASDGIVEDAVLVIRNGKIEMVGKALGSVLPAGDLPKGWVHIDGRSKHVTAGIIDAHSHTGISKGVNESGQAVTAEVRIADVTNPDAVNWYRQLAGGVTAVLNLHGSANAIGGQSQVNKLRWGCDDADDMHMAEAIPGIKFALGENPKWGNSPGERDARYPQTRMGVEALIRDRFLAAKEYAAAWDQWEQATKSAKPDGTSRPRPPQRDLELETLAQILRGERLIHCHSYRQDEILKLGRVAQEFGFKIGTYQHILEGYKVAEILRQFSGGASGFSDWWAYKVEVQDAIPQAFPIMHEQGVIVSYNSDSDELARRMNIEAAKGVKYSAARDGKPSVSNEDAWKWVTLNPAKQLRIDQYVGSLEVGKQADFVVWSGDPLSPYSIAEQTWVDGVLRFSLARDKEMRETIAKERARLTQKLLRDGPPKKKPDAKGDGKGEGKPDKKDDKPEDKKPGTTKPGTDQEKKPTNQMFAQELEEELRAEGLLGQASVMAAGGAAGTGVLDDARAGQRLPLIARMNTDAVAARRELYLDLLRRGINPEDHRRGVCGCELAR